MGKGALRRAHHLSFDTVSADGGTVVGTLRFAHPKRNGLPHHLRAVRRLRYLGPWGLRRKDYNLA
jgi:hypothetical protein